MRSLLAGLALAVTLALGGCADSDSDPEPAPATPSASATDAAASSAAVAAVRTYLRAADAGDCPAVKKVVLLPEQVECSDVRTGAGQWSEDGTDLATVPMSAEVTGEEDAAVTVTWPSGDDDTWDLQRVDGAWLVVNVDASDDA